MSGPLPRAVMASLCLLFVLGLLGLAIACSSPDEVEESAVPFVVCRSSETWTRPSEEEQSEQIWHGPFGFRYSNAEPAKLRSTFYEDFFPWHGGNSEMFDQWPLHGLWSADDISPGDPACAGGGTVGRKVISVYLLLHEPKEVSLSGDTYRIVVEEKASGFQEIQFANLVSPQQAGPTKEQPTDYNLLIVDMSGRELARADGGLRFERLTEESPVATASQAAAAAEPALEFSLRLRVTEGLSCHSERSEESGAEAGASSPRPRPFTSFRVTGWRHCHLGACLRESRPLDAAPRRCDYISGD